ncbi:hypothetical protein ASC85_24470 [Pseudomonas sp. Root401]|nr:hypothetical protein ASC85_24470 [Pseudomonas sp. Root401]
MQHRDAGLAHQAGQVVRLLMAARARHDQLRSGQQRQEKLPDRYIETERGLLQHPVAGLDAVFVPGPQQAVDHAKVFIHHPFGGAGGAGGVEHVGQVSGCQAQGERIRVVFGLSGQLGGIVERQQRRIRRGQQVQ